MSETLDNKQNGVLLDDILKKATEWINGGVGRAIVLSAFCYKDDDVTGRPNPDNTVFIKGQKSDVDKALSHIVKSFK